jgi:hypothetical protein
MNERIPYPANYFDPYGDEPTHTQCCICGEWVDFGDATMLDEYGDIWICDQCQEEVAER